MPYQGLSSREAIARLEKFGHNVLPEKSSDPLWLRFLRQFQSSLIYILLFALLVDIAIWIIEGAGGFPLHLAVGIGIVVQILAISVPFVRELLGLTMLDAQALLIVSGTVLLTWTIADAYTRVALAMNRRES